MSRRKKIIVMLMVMGILLAGCGGEKTMDSREQTTEGQEEEWQIENSCEHLSEEKAELVAKKMKEIMLDTFEEKGVVLDNFIFTFENEQEENGSYFVDGVLTVDWTNTRKPEEEPVIIGMRELQKQLPTEEEKQKAEDIIMGFLLEFETEYNITEQIPEYFQVTFEEENDLEFQLLYKEENGDEIVCYPLEQYFIEHYKEDVEQRKQLGRDTLEERLKNE